MGTMKGIARKKHKASNLASNSSNATVNRAGGVAFEIKDAALKLVTMTGGAFFAEPRYYSADSCVPTRGDGGKLSFDKLKERIQIVDDKLKGVMSCEELDDVSREILATASDIAKSDNPEDLLRIANWLRNDIYIRLTPQVLLVVASQFDSTKQFVRRYASAIVKRPDEVKTCLLMHRFFFGHKSIKNCLAQGLCDAVAKFGERGLLKYDSPNFPTWKDVLNWLPRKKGRPLSNEVAKYFITGEVVNPAATPIIAARKELGKATKLNAATKDVALKSMVNWEVLLSQFGRDEKSKREVWSFLIENNLVGYMALLRNLRNILEAKCGSKIIRMVSDRISDPQQVARSKQFPFRFLMAHQMLEQVSGVDIADANELTAAVELASNYACDNVAAMPGITAVFADNSGSMNSKVSGKSQMSCAGAANALCGIIAKRAEKPYVAAFATDVGPVRCTKNDTVIGIANKVARANTNGWATNGHRCVEWLMRNNIIADRVIILSDMQCWNEGFSGGWGVSSSSVADAWQKYVKFGAKKTWIHSVHLNGYGDNVVDEGRFVNQTSGFSEKILNMLMQTEGLIEDEAPLPTVDQIREKWSA